MLRVTNKRMPTLRGSSRAGLAIAVALAVVTGIVIYAALNRTDSDAAARSGPVGPGIAVLTAAGDIPAGTVITPDMLQVATVPQDNVLPGTIQNPELAEGSVARIPILESEQILSGKLVTVGTGGTGLSYIIPEGHRAVAVAVNKVIGAGGLLRPGDRVDVIAVVDIQLAEGQFAAGAGQIAAIPIAQNIEVLAVEQALQRVPTVNGIRTESDTTASGTLVDQPEPQPDSTVATLALTPVESLLVVMAEQGGTLRLTVRAPGDDAVIAVSPQQIIDTLQQGIAGDNAAAELYRLQLDPTNQQNSLAYVVPPGHRAMAVTVDKVVAAGGLVRPGDHVDVIAVLEVEVIGGFLTKFARSITLAQNIEVLAVEQALENAGSLSAGGGLNDGTAGEATAGGTEQAARPARGHGRHPRADAAADATPVPGGRPGGDPPRRAARGRRRDSRVAGERVLRHCG